jgi:hypothetical protein
MLYHRGSQPYQGVVTGRRAAPPISEEDCSSTLHCDRCMKPLSPSCHSKAPNKGAWYKVCSKCWPKHHAEEVWESPPACPTAVKGGDGCLCCTVAPGQQAAKAKRKHKSKLSSTKNQKLNKAVAQARRQSNEGNQ